ncbi:hypothetical protein PMAYCL1PPCAC_31653, partial [Pristionchus mayeri]
HTLSLFLQVRTAPVLEPGAALAIVSPLTTILDRAKLLLAGPQMRLVASGQRASVGKKKERPSPPTWRSAQQSFDAATPETRSRQS